MIKVGIIGSGFGLYGLLPAFNSTKGCKVVSICGRSWRELLNKEGLNAVAIAVVPSAQYKIAKAAIERGLHVFAEKPLAITYKEARTLLDLAQKNKIKHMVDFEFPEIDKWIKVKNLLDKKVYGELRQVLVNWDLESYDIKNQRSSWKTDASKGGGALSLYFSHTLHYLEHFAGRILNFKRVLSYSKESLNGGEVGVDIILKFDTSVTGYAHMSCNTKGINRHQIMFICEKATIVLENENSFTSNFRIKIYKDDKIRSLPLTKLEKTKTGEDERVKIVKKLTTRFIDSILYNKEAHPSFKEGVRVQELIELIRND